jgi:hypothetical protein
LLPVLDACLVTGYGTGSNYKAPAGWLKPFPNTSSVGCYQQPSGSLCTLFISDFGVSASVGREASATGWENLAGMMTSGSVSGSYTSSLNVGSGSGQFPLPAQCLTTGHVMIRKTNSFGVSPSEWIVFADAYTFYLFIHTAEVTVLLPYSHFAFGDIYSLAGPTDVKKCIIIGRYVVDNINAGLNSGDDTDVMNFVQVTTLTNKGKFMVRDFGQRAGSIYVIQVGDLAKYGTPNGNGVPFGGTMQTPNAADGSYWISPLWISNTANGGIRGRMRGMYHLCHPFAHFLDGQIITGTNDYAGKTFMVVRGGYNAGIWLIETSNTVETN